MNTYSLTYPMQVCKLTLQILFFCILNQFKHKMWDKHIGIHQKIKPIQASSFKSPTMRIFFLCLYYLQGLLHIPMAWECYQNQCSTYSLPIFCVPCDNNFSHQLFLSQSSILFYLVNIVVQHVKNIPYSHCGILICF